MGKFCTNFLANSIFRYSVLKREVIIHSLSVGYMYIYILSSKECSMETGVESKLIMGNLKNIPQSVIKVDINNKIFWMAC